MSEQKPTYNAGSEPLKPFVKYEATEENIKRIERDEYRALTTTGVACFFGCPGWRRGYYGFGDDKWRSDGGSQFPHPVTHFMLIE